MELRGKPCEPNPQIESLEKEIVREELLFDERNGGHRGKILVVDVAFLLFVGFLYLPPACKVFVEGQKRCSNKFSFGGGSEGFFFPETLRSAIWSTNPVSPNLALSGSSFAHIFLASAGEEKI